MSLIFTETKGECPETVTACFIDHPYLLLTLVDVFEFFFISKYISNNCLQSFYFVRITRKLRAKFTFFALLCQKKQFVP